MLKKNLIINFLNSTPNPFSYEEKGNWESSLSLKRGTEGELENNFSELMRENKN